MKIFNQKAALWLVFLFCGLLQTAYSQNTKTPQIEPVNVFKQDYSVNCGHSYNTDFIRANKVKSFRVYNDANLKDLPAGAGYSQYAFYKNGLLKEKQTHEKVVDKMQKLSAQKYTYNEKGQLTKVEEYFEDEFSTALIFVYAGENIQAMIEKDANGATGNWSKYYWQDGKLKKKITYVNNKIVQVEYHFPATKSLEELTRIQEEEKRDVPGKSVFFYLYENEKITMELWYAFSDDYVITRGYGESGRLVNVTKVKSGEARTLDYKYDGKKNLLRIKASESDNLDKYYRYKYDESQRFLQKQITKTDTEVLKQQIYRYKFWEE